ncbi:MAG: L-threonylcarbamoyladenylate synthase [Anaerolineales bacterium]|nr:L-threonylcarbamoyladenylate synthase [Anaerolineales bacterium]
METIVLKTSQPAAFNHAHDVLMHGGLVAFPTDTVYGLASLPYENETVDRLYIVKGRSHQKAIAILIGEQDDLTGISENPGKLARCLAEAFWPGPITLIVPRHPDVPPRVSSLPTVAVRMPDHPVALELLKLTGPLAVTSANLSGQASTATAEEVTQQLGGRVHLVLDGGRAPGGVPSTVVDCTGEIPEILRPGPISLEEINKVLENQ